jgi:hypothetical protein
MILPRQARDKHRETLNFAKTGSGQTQQGKLRNCAWAFPSAGIYYSQGEWFDSSFVADAKTNFRPVLKAIYALKMYENEHFTKTGSGQT